MSDIEDHSTRVAARDVTRDKIRSLTQRYVGQLPDKLSEIANRWQSACAGDGSSSNLTDLHRLVHNLGGSCSTFGFTNIGATARELEKLLKRIVDCDPLNVAASVTEISAEVKPVIEALQSQCSDLYARTFSTEVAEVTGAPDSVQPSLNTRQLIVLFSGDKDKARVLMEKLASLSFNVTVIDNLHNLKELLITVTPMAVITDSTRMRDYALAVTLVRHKEFVPVVYISAGDDFSLRLEAVRAGCAYYFKEPLDYHALSEKLKGLNVEKKKEAYQILIVDDEPDVANYYSLLLEEEGMKTRTLNNPFDIIEHLHEFTPDLIIMDMYMDGCTGTEVAGVIRQFDEYLSIPIVFLSNESDIKKQLTAMSKGAADDFINKSMATEHVISSITMRAERMRIIRSFNTLHDYSRTLEHEVEKRTQELHNAYQGLKEKSEQLAQLNRHLEDRVQEEIRQRTEKEQMLVQQSKMAAMGEMLSMIAHQWRQPLSSVTTIAGNLQVYMELDMVDKNQFTGLLQDINEQCQYLSNTISDFRDFFNPKKKLEVVRLDSIIAHTLRIIGKSLENHSIELINDCRFYREITTYPNELMQVFLNILKNAKEALEDSKTLKPVIAVKGYEHGNLQVVEISDNAGGIPKPVFQRIFEPYYTTKEKRGGTGIGLYMSHIIVEKHCNGKLNVSNTDTGACFRIELPVP